MSITFDLSEMTIWINKNLERTDRYADALFKEGVNMALHQAKTYNKEDVPLSDFKDWINQQLKLEDKEDKYKSGLCIALEHVLYATNQYKGYNDNYWIEKGCREWYAAGKPEGDMDKYSYGPSGQQYNRRYY